jgi:flagellar basal-body rod protein FlgB
MTRTNAGHLDGNKDNPLSAFTQYRSEYQGAVDGNTVNMDIERSAFTENSVQMEALLNFVNGDFKKLQTAITSQ